jgi:hypothetical protein
MFLADAVLTLTIGNWRELWDCLIGHRLNCGAQPSKDGLLIFEGFYMGKSIRILADRY